MKISKTIPTASTWRDKGTGLGLYETGFRREITFGRNFYTSFVVRYKLDKQGKAVLNPPIMIYANEIEDATGLPGPCLGTIRFDKIFRVIDRGGVFENKDAAKIVLKAYDADIRDAWATSHRLAKEA